MISDAFHATLTAPTWAIAATLAGLAAVSVVAWKWGRS